jgi:hypothetical protein
MIDADYFQEEQEIKNQKFLYNETFANFVFLIKVDKWTNNLRYCFWMKHLSF